MKLDNNKNKGNAGLAIAIAYFGANGYTVSIPLNDTQDYDLVVDLDGNLKTVQVKTCNFLTNGTYQCQLRTISGTSRRVIKTVKDTNVDLLFCLTGDGTLYLIPISELNNRTTIQLTKEKSKYSNSSFDSSLYIVKI